MPPPTMTPSSPPETTRVSQDGRPGHFEGRALPPCRLLRTHYHSGTRVLLPLPVAGGVTPSATHRSAGVRKPEFQCTYDATAHFWSAQQSVPYRGPAPVQEAAPGSRWPSGLIQRGSGDACTRSPESRSSSRSSWPPSRRPATRMRASQSWLRSVPCACWGRLQATRPGRTRRASPARTCFRLPRSPDPVRPPRPSTSLPTGAALPPSPSLCSERSPGPTPGRSKACPRLRR